MSSPQPHCAGFLQLNCLSAINLFPKNKLGLMYLPFSASMHKFRSLQTVIPRDSFTLLHRLPKGRFTKQEGIGDYWVVFLL